MAAKLSSPESSDDEYFEQLRQEQLKGFKNDLKSDVGKNSKLTRNYTNIAYKQFINQVTNRNEHKNKSLNEYGVKKMIADKTGSEVDITLVDGESDNRACFSGEIAQIFNLDGDDDKTSVAPSIARVSSQYFVREVPISEGQLLN